MRAPPPPLSSFGSALNSTYDAMDFDVDSPAMVGLVLYVYFSVEFLSAPSNLRVTKLDVFSLVPLVLHVTKVSLIYLANQ